MTKERLEQYRSAKAEIKELDYRLKHLGEGDSLIGNDVILDYASGYPMPQAVVGYDYEKYYDRKERYGKLRDNLAAECGEVEDFINGIGDSQLRRIFRMRYMEGMLLESIGRLMHLDKSNVSRKIDHFIKSQRTQQTQQYNKN